MEIVIQKKFKFEKEGASRKCKKRPLLSRDQEVRLFNKLLYWLDRVVFLFHFLLDPALLNSHYEKDFTLLSPFHDN